MGQDNSGEKSAKPVASGEGAKTVDARVARRRQDAIGRRLRQMYDDVVNEDVPTDFMSFLEEADSKRPKPDDNGPPAVDRPPEPASAGRAVKSEH
jgi:Anti-sigma factor NepR